jgi:tetratricopeptide (TPR) repeat protein
MKTIRNIVASAVIVLALSSVIYGAVSSSARRIQQGATMPEFSAVDTAGKPFAYRRSSNQVLMLVFLSSQQKRSQKAIEDLNNVLSDIPADKLKSLQVAFVMQNVDNSEFIASIQKDAPVGVQIIGDKQYKIWGKFGVIATPTVLISDPVGKVLCVKPGHTYDFSPVIKSRLFQALNIPNGISSDNASNVRTVVNNTLPAKAKRHLQMAELLSSKNRFSSAIEQARMAYEIDPNSAEVTLMLGELLCQAGQPQEAVKLVSSLSGRSDREKARINLVMGWAKRQLGQLKEAEKFLQEGIKQDPTSPRLRFELGRIYQKRNDSKRAMQTYFQALQLIYREEST